MIDDRSSDPPTTGGHDPADYEPGPAGRSEETGDLTDDEIDTGEPIEPLRDLALSPGPQFFARVRGTIGRRVLWSDLATFTSEAFGYATLEHLAMFFHFVRIPDPVEESPEKPRNDNGDGDGTDQS